MFVRIRTLPLIAILVASTGTACGGGQSAGSGTQGPGSQGTGSPTAPSITAQPGNQTVMVGQSATFTVTAAGTLPLTYQWQKNGTSVAGATGAIYTTPATTNSDNGAKFLVKVSNSAGTATSNQVTLSVSTQTGKSYSTDFSLTENPISEANSWINGGAVGVDWGNIRSTTNLAFGASLPAVYADPTAVLSGTWAANQQAQATVRIDASQPNCCHEVELRLRTTIAAHSITGYEINCSVSSSSPYIQIVRWNGALGKFSYVNTTGGTGCGNGDVLKASIVGNSITVYKNGTQVLQGNDATFTSGSPGIGFYDDQDSSWADFGFSNFSASEITGAASAAVVVPSTARGTDGAISTEAAEIGTWGNDAVNVLTYRNDNGRTGQNLRELALSPITVNPSSFGRQAFLAVTGKIDAQPLFASEVMIARTSHDVLFVATEDDLVYAFDTNSNRLLWGASALGPSETPAERQGCRRPGLITGISATPVIDREAGPNGTIFIVASSEDDEGTFHQRLHALDLSTGNEQPGSPAEIDSVSRASGAIRFEYEVRSALFSVKGTVYLSLIQGCASRPSGGWVIGYSESTLQQVSAVKLPIHGDCASSAQVLGMAADEGGTLFLLAEKTKCSGNPTAHSYVQDRDCTSALIKLSTMASASPTLVNQCLTAQSDSSAAESRRLFNLSGPLVLPELANESGVARRSSLVIGGSSGVYLVDRRSIQQIGLGQDEGKDPTAISSVIDLPASQGAPAFFDDRVYFGVADGALSSFTISRAGFLRLSDSRTEASFWRLGPVLSVSADGNHGGIVWAIEDAGSWSVLHAYDATNLSIELYNSDLEGLRDRFWASDGVPPTVAKGRVYLAGTDGVTVFGLLSTEPAR